MPQIRNCRESLTIALRGGETTMCYERPENVGPRGSVPASALSLANEGAYGLPSLSLASAIVFPALTYVHDSIMFLCRLQ